MVIHTRNRKISVTGRLKVTARWARPRCKNTVEATKAMHETPKSDEETQGEGDQHQDSYITYLLVGRAKAHSARVGDMVVNAGEQLSTRDLIINEALRCFAEVRLRRHVAQRHRRRCRDTSAQPVAPLSLQGGVVPRGVRALARRLVRTSGRGRSRVRSTAGRRSNW